MALKPVHVDATYVAEIAELVNAAVSSVDCYFEHAPTRQRFHDEQVLTAAGRPNHPAPGRHRSAERQVRANVSVSHGRFVLGQQLVQLPHHVLATVHGGLAGRVQRFVLVTWTPMRRDTRLFA